MTRIVIADDHPIVLEGLTQLFALEDDIEVVARCTNGEEALAATRAQEPDVLVLDVRMPRLSGLAVLRMLSAEKNRARVVLLTAQLNETERANAVRYGAAGIVLKETAACALLECVRAVAQGETWLHDAPPAATGPREAGRALTPRELDIVRMTAAGARNREIAAQLGISEGTVKMYLHTIYEKLGVNSRVALANYARENALI
ncbi:MAG TPA: response regulator transcription factor [Thermoanaerobaculia bacterium]|nr:response regulator transcription factor [Thermoanaerobaculia bacterium]